MVTIFKSYGLWRLVDKGIPIPDEKLKGKIVEAEGSSAVEDDEQMMEFYMKDAKALGIIQGAVLDQIFPRIVNAETSKGAWKLLYKEFHGGEQVRSVKLQSLRREFEYTKMKEDETLSSYLTRLNDLINQMKTFEESLSNERLEVTKKVQNHSVEHVANTILESVDSKGNQSAIIVIDLGSSKEAEGSSAVEDDEQMMEFYLKDAKALGIIQGAVLDQIFPRIVNAETSKEAWELLYKEFHGGEQVRSVKLQSLRREFEYTKMKEDETLSSYLTRLNDLINQMKTFEESLSNESGNRWQVGGHQESSKSQCRTCGKYHFGECRFKGKAKCYNCNRFRHWARECPNGKNMQKANCTNQMELTGNMFYAASEFEKSSKISEWYIDSGCSNHMTGNMDLLIDVKRNIYGRV
nr:uncharacterized protein LOC125419549 [Ziziphus jujuba var. spinosa]